MMVRNLNRREIAENFVRRRVLPNAIFVLNNLSAGSERVGVEETKNEVNGVSRWNRPS